jgi:hypothetical protein
MARRTMMFDTRNHKNGQNEITKPQRSKTQIFVLDKNERRKIVHKTKKLEDLHEYTNIRSG